MSQFFLILVDAEYDSGRGRGVLACDTAGIGAEAVNILARHARGLVAVAMPLERAFALDLSPMARSTQRPGRPITFANVESIACSETGISAAERALTLHHLGSWNAAPADFTSPGHIVVTVVPARLFNSQHPPVLSEVAYRRFAQRRNSLAIAWADILDDSGELASATDCAALAGALGAELEYVEPRDARAFEPATAAG